MLLPSMQWNKIGAQTKKAGIMRWTFSGVSPKQSVHPPAYARLDQSNQIQFFVIPAESICGNEGKDECHPVYLRMRYVLQDK